VGLTTLGIALCVLLMVFLMAVYKGVEFGSVEYVKSNDAELWVLQEHATNILRTTSILPVEFKEIIEGIEGVSSADPVGFLLASVKTEKGPASLYLTGFDPSTGIGGPPVIVDGRNVERKGEIVLDAAFAKKYGLDSGDFLPIKKDTLLITGICSGSNMFVIQYAFMSLDQLWSVMSFRNIVSCFQVNTKESADKNQVINNLYLSLNDVVVYEKEVFLANNLREMQSGLLPLLFMVASISAIVLTAILSLILSVNILEQRNDYAVMKALGSPGFYIHGLIHIQSIILSFTGFILGIVLFHPVVLLVQLISPEVSVISTFSQYMVAGAGILIISVFSSLMPVRQISHIYPLEVFK
jgi:putative ABC transport system permease protein